MRLVAGQLIPNGVAGSEVGLIDMGSVGCGIVRNDDTGVFLDIGANLSNIAFASWFFDYFSCSERISLTVNLPARPVTYRNNGGKGSSTYVVPSNGSADYVVSTTARTYTPVVIGYCPTTSKAVGASTVYASGDSFRVLTFSVSTTSILVSEVYYVGNTEIPAKSLDIVALVMDQGIDSSLPRDNTYALKMSPDEVILGQGRIDSSRRYIFKEANNTLGYKTIISPSLELCMTTSIQMAYSAPYTVAATRLRAIEDDSVVSEVKNKWGLWSATSGDDFPYIAMTGTSIGVNMP